MSINQLSDKDLVCRIVAKDDEAAFCELYVRYRQKLFAFSLTFVKDTHAAEDVIQDVFVTVWTGRQVLDPNMSFSSYLYTITRNRLLNFLRQANQDTKVKGQLIKAGKTYNEVTEDQLADAEYSFLLNIAIDQMSPLRKKIYKLSREEKMTHKEIAQHLNISTYTVIENISAALKHIKKFLSSNAGLYFKTVLLFSLIHFL